MSTSIFSRLRRYRPTPDRDPLEDFTTEAFAAVLDANPDLSRAFASHLARRAGWVEPVPPAGRVTWATQVRVETGIIDMVADVEAGPVLVVENKVWTSLGENQIAKYRTAMVEKYGSRVRTVLITARRVQWTQDADLQMTWADVHLALADAAATAGPGLYVEDFLGFLRSEGLGPAAPVAHESLLSWVPAQRLVPALEDLFARLDHELPSDPLPALTSVIGERIPKELMLARANEYPTGRARGPQWGRVGLDLAAGWRPGIFVGVMLDGSSHGVAPVDPVKGPDFTLILSFNTKPGSPSWEDFVLSAEFTALRERLKRDAGPYSVFDVLDLPPKHQNRWHPLHLRRPLLDVLKGTSTASEQATRFVEEMKAAVDVLVAGGELAALKARLPGPPEWDGPGLPDHL